MAPKRHSSFDYSSWINAGGGRQAWEVSGERVMGGAVELTFAFVPPGAEEGPGRAPGLVMHPGYRLDTIPLPLSL